MISVNGKWNPPPKELTLGDNEVHVWYACLDQTEVHVGRLKETLSHDENQRATRFYFEKDRKHFIVARGALREILGRYLSRQPDGLCFSYNSYGKPALEDGGISFNVSHSGDFALFAICLNRKLGIDIERIRPDFINEGVAERFFAPEEVAVLHALPVKMQPDAFFDCWTRKEAFIKATGQGISFGLDRFVVSLTPGEPAVLHSIKGDREEAHRWSLQELHVDPDYKAALAVEGHGWQHKQWQWRPKVL